MYGPGEYRPDPSEGVTAAADLPPPELVPYRRNDSRHPCPRCGHSAYRDKEAHRTLHDLGNLDRWCPRDLIVTYSQHYCTKCRQYFNADLSDLAPPGSQYTHRVINLAVRLVVEDGLPYRPASWHLWRDHRVFVPFATIQNWVEAGEKKAQGRMSTDFLDWAFTDLSGYVAVDELYDGPFCILSAVDNRCYKRLLSEVLDHAPTHDDIRAFLGRLKTALAARDLTLRGITTDGSALYPEPLAEIFSGVPHQLCQFHVIKELTTGVLKAVAQERARLSQSKPKLKRGRPASKDQEARRRVRKSKAIQQKIRDLFPDRFLFVQRQLKPSERKRLLQITRGFPQMRKLRELMEQVYALFDRRCRTQTALDKLTKLRRRLSRFKHLGETLKKLFSPTLEKALTFLDDTLLPATSNAVERGNRRYRKMQKSIYSVRTQEQITARIALDMWREAQGEGREQTLHALHEARAGLKSPGVVATVSYFSHITNPGKSSSLGLSICILMHQASVDLESKIER